MSLIPLVEQDSANDAQEALLAQIPPLNLFKALLHAPGLTTHIAQLGGNLLYATKLDARMREAAILRLGYMTDCGYEIAHHDRIGREVGLTEADLAALKNGDVGALEPSVGVAVRWVQESLETGRASPDLVQETVARFGAEQAVELAVTVGYYTMLAQILRSFEIPVEGGPASASIIKIDERPAALE